MYILDTRPSHSMTLELARTLEDEDDVQFELDGDFYHIYSSSNGGWMVDVYQSLDLMESGDGDTDDGGLCSGCSYDAIGFMIPEHKATGNGGKNSFYDITAAKDLDDLADLWDLDPFMANQLKSLMANVGSRHDGTTKLREAKKSMHYGDRRVKRELLRNAGNYVATDADIFAEMINDQEPELQAKVISLLVAIKTYTLKG